MKILCDFDGTTAQNDIGNLFFRTFAGPRCHDIVRQWKDGEISSRECLVRECEITRVAKSQFEAFVDAQELDPFFTDFVRVWLSRSVEIEIVSDGLDFYVERILKNHNLYSVVNFKANHVFFYNHDRIRLEFPYFDLGCGRCANCKGYHVRQAKKRHRTVVYVGDGLSDRCGAEQADIVFAKKGRDLLRFCRENGIDHDEFVDFKDVHQKLNEKWPNIERDS